MPPSSFIAPLGGYNAGSIDYLAPQAALGPITGYDKNDGTGTAWWKIDNSATRAFCFDKLLEYTAAAGVTIDSVLLKDGGVRLLNNLMLQARNAANSADIDLLKLNASNQLQFGTTFDVFRTTFTPNSYSSNIGSWSTVALNPSFYIPIGKLLLFSFTALGTIAGSPTELYATMPAGVTAAIDKQALMCSVYDSGVQKAGSAVISTSGNSIVIRKWDNTAFANAAASGASVAGFIIIS
jgi:hypothetical protein